MGYSTSFEGSFKLDKPLKPEHAAYLRAFAGTRRMRRSEATYKLLDPVREAVGLPAGGEGQYFVGGKGFAGQDHDDTVLNYNSPPATQPGLWCKWVPNADGTEIAWNGHEKFYDYVEWLEYLVAHFLKPWGYTLDGEVTWQGEESSDRGMIVVEKNKIRTKRARLVYEDE